MGASKEIEELLKHKRVLEKTFTMNDGVVTFLNDKELDDHASQSLQLLAKTVPTILQLSKTKIGVTVAHLMKHSCIEIREQARELVKTWKGIVASQKGNKSQDSLNKIQSETSNNIITNKEYNGAKTGSPMRDRARAFLWKSLVEGVDEEQSAHMNLEQTYKLAEEIEEALFKAYPSGTQSLAKEYSIQLKSIKWNLADKKNPDINQKLYAGVILPDELAVMKSEDMASEAKKREREYDRKESLEACQSDWDLKNMKSKEGQFPCRKCKSLQTVYFQMQTRSSDEPMTTFVTCLVCRNRYKF